jgi:Methyltransferase domain
MRYNPFGWFEEDAQRFLQSLIDRHRIQSVIEVGTFLGKSAAFWARQCQLTCVDTWKGDREIKKSPYIAQLLPTAYEQFRFNMKHLGLLDRITIVRRRSLDAARLKALHADLIFIDASHYYASVKADIKAWLPKADVILCGHDYTLAHPDVMRAADEAGARHRGSIWYIVMKPGRTIRNRNVGR